MCILFFVFFHYEESFTGYISVIKLTMLCSFCEQAHSQDRIWGGAEPPKVDLLDPKSGLFLTSPSQPPYKNPIFGHFVVKSGPFARFGGDTSHPCTPTPPHPLATGLFVRTGYIFRLELPCYPTFTNPFYNKDIVMNILVRIGGNCRIQPTLSSLTTILQ